MTYILLVSEHIKAEVQINWRHLYTISQVMEKIKTWLTDLGTNGKATILTADSEGIYSVGWANKIIRPDSPPSDVLVRYATERVRPLKENLVSTVVPIAQMSN